jgi:hypothetical protein
MSARGPLETPATPCASLVPYRRRIGVGGDVRSWASVLAVGRGVDAGLVVCGACTTSILRA